MSVRNFEFKKFFNRLYTKAIEEEDLLSSGAQVAFYFAFALFPLLLFLVSLFGLVLDSANDLRAEMFYYLRQVMPSSAFDLVRKTVEEVTENSSGSKLTLGVLIALWSSSAGIDSIRVALDGVYNLTETRSWWKNKLISLSMTLGLSLLIAIALTLIFYGGKFMLIILDWLNLPISSLYILLMVQWATVLVVLLAFFALVYNFLPCHKKYKWEWVTPGAIIGIILWVLLCSGFRLYLSYFNSYDKTYGSLGAVIILMLWLYLTALVILIGGTINAVLEEMSDPEMAEAGANKAVAKEIVENPEKDIEKVAESKKQEKLAEITGNAQPKDSYSIEPSARIAPVSSFSAHSGFEMSERLSATDNVATEKGISKSTKSDTPARKLGGEITDQTVPIETHTNGNVPQVHAVPANEEISRKPYVNLLIGTAFGFLAGMMFTKKKE